MAKSKYQGKNDIFYLVNPKGAVHSVARGHAKVRLAQVGWRLAEDAEIEKYNKAEIQRHDQPIAKPWTPDPDVEPDMPPQDTE